MKSLFFQEMLLVGQAFKMKEIQNNKKRTEKTYDDIGRNLKSHSVTG